MRSWEVTGFGAPRDVARLVDAPEPVPGPGEVVVAGVAAGLNFPDVLLCKGLYQDRPALPFTPGFELAGTVHAAGPDVALRPGARVAGAPALPKGQRGGLTQLAVLRADQVYPIPDAMGFVDAATLPVTYQTAHLALHRRARLAAGEVLLVHGGAGGVGTAAIQLGLAAGARVFATAHGEEKLALCRSLGATAIDYGSEDFAAVVREQTDGHGADVIIDQVGGEVFEQSRRCIADEGRLLVVGFAGGAIGRLGGNQMLLKNFAVIGVNREMQRIQLPETFAAQHDALCELYEAGAVRPVVQAELPIEAVLDGWDLLARRQVLGKLVVRLRT